MSDDDASANTESLNRVGYGSPPESMRFKKGVSGNPKGRPKGSLNVSTVFVKALRQKVVINEQGKRRTVTKLEAALKQLVNKAATGDLRALHQLLELARDAEIKQNLPGELGTVLSDLDQEVIDGILKRFPAATKDDGEIQEASDARD
jgi:hypothetical protein